MPRAPMTNVPGKNRFARWSAIIIANLVILFVVGVSTVRESYQDWKVDQEMKSLKGQVDELEGRRMRLSTVLQKLNSLDAIDEEARARLGMQKPGEKVVVLRGTNLLADQGPKQQAVEDAPDNGAERSNPKRWLDYFFSH